MISNLGTVVVQTGNKIIPEHTIHNWKCLDCGYNMTTDVHWEKKKGHMPEECPQCKTRARIWREQQDRWFNG